MTAHGRKYNSVNRREALKINDIQGKAGSITMWNTHDMEAAGKFKEVEVRGIP